MDLLVRDVVPADAEVIVAILNPIIEARVHTAFDAPLVVGTASQGPKLRVSGRRAETREAGVAPPPQRGVKRVEPGSRPQHLGVFFDLANDLVTARAGEVRRALLRPDLP